MLKRLQYDFAIIGAGIAGCSIAYKLKEAGYNVALCSKDGLFGKTSLTAGAFLTPKLSSGGFIGDFANRSYSYSIDFYSNLDKSLLKKRNITFVARDAKDIEKFDLYRKKMPFQAINYSKNSIEYDEGYVINPLKLCTKLSKDIEIFAIDIKKLSKKDNLFVLNGAVSATNIILSTGAYSHLIDEPYLKGNYNYGSVVTMENEKKIEKINHTDIMYSSFDDDQFKIGSTHHKILFDDVNSYSCKDEDKVTLINKVRDTGVDLKVEEVSIEDGVRFSQNDFLPVIGPIVNFVSAIRDCPNIVKGHKITNLPIYENILAFHSFGARGFTYAPYLADFLVKHINENSDIEFKFSSERLFYKYARKVQQ